MNGWKPIESAPRDGSRVDLWVSYGDGEGDRVPDCWWQDGGWAFDWHHDRGSIAMSLGWAEAPTHWMPLPTPPEPPERQG